MLAGKFAQFGGGGSQDARGSKAPRNIQRINTVASSVVVLQDVRRGMLQVAGVRRHVPLWFAILGCCNAKYVTLCPCRQPGQLAQICPHNATTFLTSLLFCFLVSTPSLRLCPSFHWRKHILLSCIHSGEIRGCSQVCTRTRRVLITKDCA